MLDIHAIKDKVAPIVKKYNVIGLDVFGSYAEGTATESSDIDFLVLFSAQTPSIFKVMGFQDELSDALGLSVDVVTLPLANPSKIIINKTEKII